MDTQGITHTRILVAGLGLHGGGVATVRWLVRHGARVTVTDLRSAEQLRPALAHLRDVSVRYVLGKHRLTDFTSAQLIVQNPAMPENSVYLRAARRRGVRIENEASLFFRFCPAPVIGITGTRGKSTVTALIGKLLAAPRRRVWVGGNIRTAAMLSFLDRVRRNDTVVLELSSWQLERMTEHGFSPQMAVVTNVLPDHLNRYASLSAYLQAKRGILLRQNRDGIAVLNYRNSATRELRRSAIGRVVWFSSAALGSGQGSFVRAGVLYCRLGKKTQRIIATRELALAGQHNLENVAAGLVDLVGMELRQKQNAGSSAS